MSEYNEELTPEFFDEFKNEMDAYYKANPPNLFNNTVKVCSSTSHPERFVDWDEELKRLQ